jgi:Flp pilus assembly protein TadG
MPTRRAKWPDLRSERGSNVIEMALVFPIMAILTVAFMDFSIAMWSQHTLTHAARAGARFATVRQATDTQITNVIKAAAVGLHQDDIDVDIVWDDPDKKPGSTVTIVVQYAFNPVTPFVVRQNQTLEGRAAMVVLR